jgi:type III secretory pathway component EscU
MYRIIVEVQKNGEENFYVQKQILLYFWKYFKTEVQSNVTDLYYNRRTLYRSLKYAKDEIQKDVEKEYKKEQEKIIRKYILKD